MSSKKVLFLLDCLAGGGAQRAIVNTVNNFNQGQNSLGQYRIYFALLNSDGPLKDDIRKDVKTYDLGIKSAKFGLFKLARKIQDIKPDIIVSTPAYVSELTYLSCKLMKSPPALIMRSATMESVNMKEESKLVHFLLKKAYNKAKGIIALTEEMKKDLTEVYKIEPEKISVIPNMVDIKLIDNKKMSMPEEKYLFENSNIPVIVTVGRLVKVKGYEYLLKAFREYLKSNRGRLIIIGDGPLKDELENTVNSLGIKRDVYFIGFKKNPYKYIYNSDIFVLSSLWEGFPNALIEAMACGTAVIAGNCSSGPAEIITSGLDGLLVPVKDVKEMADAMGRLADNRLLRVSIAENALATVRKYSPENIIKRYKEVFKKF